MNPLKQPLTQVLLYEPNFMWKKLVIYEFIQKSILIRLIATKGEIMETLMKVPHALLLMNVTQMDEHLFKTYKHYKENGQINNSIFYAYTNNVQSYQLLHTIRESHVDNLIIRGNKIKAFCDQILNQCKKDNIHLSRRNYIRIAPSKYDQIRTLIRLNNNKTLVIISGNVANLSLGGLVFSHKKELVPSVKLRKGMFIKHTSLYLQESTLNLSSHIAEVRGNFLALRFANMDDYTKQILSMYICSNIENYYNENDIQLQMQNLSTYLKPSKDSAAQHVIHSSF